MRNMLIATLFVLPVAGADWDPPKPRSPKSLLNQAFGPAAFARSGAVAVADEVLNTPSEWGRGADGLGKRFVSSYGRQLIGTTVQYSVASLRHEDLCYFSAERKDLKGRMEHALLSVVLARNTITGDPMLATGRLSGVLVGGSGSRMWMPARYHTLSSAAGTTGISLGIAAGVNLIREFFPKRWHR